jgi:hypothetical protein
MEEIQPVPGAGDDLVSPIVFLEPLARISHQEKDFRFS